MPSYRLTYFLTRGRAEPIRLLLTDAGVAFDDHRLTPDEWTTLKESGNYPLNQMPILEIDGGVMVQSRAIFRHLSRKYGYDGTTEEEKTRIDVACEVMEDLCSPVWDLVFGPHADNEAYKDKIKESWLKATGPLHLKFLEKILENNPEGNGYFVGKDATTADFVFYAFIESVLNIFPITLDDYPKLQANREAVKSRQKIADYLAKQTPSFM